MLHRLLNTNTYGYSVEPQYLMRIDDWARSTTSLTQNGVYFTSPYAIANSAFPGVSQVQNASTFDANESLQSGEYFGRFNWTLTADYNRLMESSFTEEDKSGDASLQYALDHTIALLGTIGYDYFDSSIPLTMNLTGPTILGGFTFTPNEGSTVTFQAGVRRHFPVYIGNAHWVITPSIQFDGLLTDSITTPQGSLLGGLNGLGSLPYLARGFPVPGTTGSLPGGILPGAGEPSLSTISPLFNNGLAFTNAVYHDRLGTAGVTFIGMRTNFAVNFNFEQRTRAGPLSRSRMPIQRCMAQPFL